MNRFLALLLIVSATACAAHSQQIKSGSAVYIEPMGGYETYLAAALVKKHVPLVVVTKKDKADYIIKATTKHTAPSAPSVVVSNRTTVNNGNDGSNDTFNQGFALGAQAAARRAALGYTSTSIEVIEPNSSRIEFAYASNNPIATRAAEDCANHLKKFIEKQEKRHR